MMDDLDSSVDSDKSGIPTKCPRLIIDGDDRTFSQITDDVNIDRCNDHNHMMNYSTHLNEITDLRHESLNQLLKSNIEFIKNENIELKPIDGRSKIVYVNHQCDFRSVNNCRHKHSASDHNNNNSTSIGIAAMMENCQHDCEVSLCHRNENMRHNHMHADGQDGDGATNNMLIERDNSGDNASQYAQLIDDESKHCTSIDDKCVSSRVALVQHI